MNVHTRTLSVLRTYYHCLGEHLHNILGLGTTVNTIQLRVDPEIVRLVSEYFSGLYLFDDSLHSQISIVLIMETLSRLP